jgi:hypothetical protein
MIKEFEDLFKLNEEERKIARSFDARIQRNMPVEEVRMMLAWLIDKNHTDPKGKISLRLARKLSDIDLFITVAECRYIQPKLRDYVAKRLYTCSSSAGQTPEDKASFNVSSGADDLPF